MPDMLGKTVADRAKLTMLQGIIWEVKKAATMGCFTNDDKQSLGQETLMKMGKLADYMEKMKGPYLIGEYVSYLDFYMYELL